MDKTTPMKNKPLVNATCKLGTKGCFEDGRCHALGNCDNKIVTNADKIRSMSDEELAEFLRQTVWEEGANLFDCADYICDYPCAECKAYLKWLQSEAE